MPNLPRMESYEKLRVRAAASRAIRLYPGAIGQLISRELMTWEEFGYRLDNDKSLVLQAVNQILEAELPTSKAPGFASSSVGYE